MIERLQPRSAASLPLLLSLLFVAPHANAQGQLPEVAPLGARPQGQPQQPPPGVPETHAAPDGDESTLPEGNEPTLPADPLAMSDLARERIGSDAEPETLGTPKDAKRQFYGLYYNEEAGEYRYRVAFPVWAERTMPSEADPTITDRASLYGGLYYTRRGAENRDTIAFPIYWNLENPLEESRTTIAGPFVNRRTPTESDDWFLPLYATGRREVGGYTLIPPLLTSLHRDEEGGFNLVGPLFCDWEGSASCDPRTAHDIDLGLAPFYFFGQNKKRLYEVVPPLGHYYRYELRSQNWLNVWGPYFRQHRGERELFHLIPFYWSIWGAAERHTTVFPFYHYGHGENGSLFITPFFLNKHSESGADTFVTWGYARHRGPTELDMITPLYFHHRDPRIGLDRKLFFPFLYTNTSPREEHTVFFPFWARKLRYGVSDTLWVTPVVRHSDFIRGWSLAVNPLLYVGDDGNSWHRVVAPLTFDFGSPRGRTTIIPPLLFARIDKPETLHQVAGLTYYSERRYGSTGQKEWQFHLLPLFSYGRSPSGHFYNFLFGLTGYTREGTMSKLRLLYIPIKLSD